MATEKRSMAQNVQICLENPPSTFQGDISKLKACLPCKTGQKRDFRFPTEQGMAIEKWSMAQNVQVCLENHSSKFEGDISKLKACLPSKTDQKRGFHFTREQDMGIE